MRPIVTRRRIVITVAVVAIVLGVFVLRLIDIQVVRASALNAQSKGKMSSSSVVFGNRGDIVDRNGVVLAEAEMRYNITASPKNAKDFTRTVDGKKVTITPADAAVEIAQYTKQNPNDIINVLNQALQENSQADFAFIAKGVDLAAYKAIDALNIPWIYFESAPARVYPNGAVAGNLIGYVGSEGKPLAGLEQTENACVGAVDGEQTYERGAADGVMIPGSKVVTKEAKNGGELVLTIDSDLQWYSQQLLAKQVQAQGGSWGIALVLEAKTGKLISVADYPSVDPNNVDGTASKFRGSYAFSAPYEPGSTMKALTAAMLLDTGKANAATRVNAPYRMTFPNGASFHDSGYHEANLTLAGVIVQSSNVGISLLGQNVSAGARYDYLKKFGLGSTSSVNFLAESAGILHPASEWDNQMTYQTMFGQGLGATAIQMASAYQTLANGGVRLPVSLIEGCKQPDGTLVKPKLADPIKVVSPTAARGVVDMLENVYSQGWLRDKLALPGYRIAAKTGTAEQSNGQGSYSGSYIVTLAGMVPAEDPQYIVLTTIADARLNSTAAVAPVFHDLIANVIKKFRIQPSKSGTPTLQLYY
jgi:cell division protein FtsI (penicillin-binding protein 3)